MLLNAQTQDTPVLLQTFLPFSRPVPLSVHRNDGTACEQPDFSYLLKFICYCWFCLPCKMV